MANTPDLWRDADRSFSALGSWRPLLKQLDDFFNEALGSSTLMGARDALFSPPCDIEERSQAYVLRFDIPGVNKDDLTIEAHSNQLTISGERREAHQRGEEGRVQFMERRHGQFTRTITLPSDIQAADIEASYENGVLTMVVPKSETARPTRIKIGERTGPSLKGAGLGNGQSQGTTINRSQSQSQPPDASATPPSPS